MKPLTLKQRFDAYNQWQLNQITISETVLNYLRTGAVEYVDLSLELEDIKHVISSGRYKQNNLTEFVNRKLELETLLA